MRGGEQSEPPASAVLPGPSAGLRTFSALHSMLPAACTPGLCPLALSTSDPSAAPPPPPRLSSLLLLIRPQTGARGPLTFLPSQPGL